MRTNTCSQCVRAFLSTRNYNVFISPHSSRHDGQHNLRVRGDVTNSWAILPISHPHYAFLNNRTFSCMTCIENFFKQKLYTEGLHTCSIMIRNPFRATPFPQMANIALIESLFPEVFLNRFLDVIKIRYFYLNFFGEGLARPFHPDTCSLKSLSKNRLESFFRSFVLTSPRKLESVNHWFSPLYVTRVPVLRSVAVIS